MLISHGPVGWTFGMRRCSDFGRVLELVTEPPALAGVGVPLLLPARKEASASLLLSSPRLLSIADQNSALGFRYPTSQDTKILSNKFSSRPMTFFMYAARYFYWLVAR